ncbi:MAG: prepilin-type N-terminal cleavage/methylation domain-containing protein [Chitinispirillaceae bacterium]|nr:prepilin-type N-terminal cleavage/methylation domain-containing protein [Chitinispirillaceae bacterium]
MFNKTRKNNKGFTLVEVIVVAVIVAVLALVAIQLYQGYVRESRTNTAENLAASAAGFLQSAINIDESAWSAPSPATLNPSSTWELSTDQGNRMTFTCPRNATIATVGNYVQAWVGGQSSQTYGWNIAGGS